MTMTAEDEAKIIKRNKILLIALVVLFFLTISANIAVLVLF